MYNHTQTFPHFPFCLVLFIFRERERERERELNNLREKAKENAEIR